MRKRLTVGQLLMFQARSSTVVDGLPGLFDSRCWPNGAALWMSSSSLCDRGCRLRIDLEASMILEHIDTVLPVEVEANCIPVIFSGA